MTMYKKRMERPEQPVQISIVRYLKMQGFFVFAPDCGINVQSKIMQATYKKMGRTAGVADLVVIIPNGTLNIEVKKPQTLRYSDKSKRMITDEQAGRQSEKQKKYEKFINLAPGHHYIVATDVSQVAKYISENGIKPVPLPLELIDLI